MSFFLFTLGCKVNQYESHALREAWLGKGMREAASPGEASVILINSCAVTARAVSDVRAAARRLRKASPDAEIVVTGCAAEILRDELAAMPEISRVVPQRDKAGLLESASRAEPFLPPQSQKAVQGGPAFPPFAVSGYARSRAVLKIQDGCSHGCAYCIVPLARGSARSRLFADSLAETRRLLEAGFREIVISGVNLRQYREPGAADREVSDFWSFLARLDAALAPEWVGRARLRLSSLEPGQLGQRALDVLAGCRLTAPHLHLSLQSGSSSVLRRMGRGHYDPATLPAFLAVLRMIWPVFGLGADLLTGFPGESDGEFADGLALVRELPLTYAHVFPYSRRPGTRAASMGDQVPQGAKKERAARLRELVRGKKAEFLRTQLSVDRIAVVFEQRDESSGPEQEGRLRGVNEFYTDCRLVGQAPADLARRSLIAAKSVGMDGEVLLVSLRDQGDV